MAAKPKTYPEQIQELKTQLANKQAELERALLTTEEIPAMQDELASLREQLAAKFNADVQNVRTDKAMQTDLEQRVLQAETARNEADRVIRNLRAQIEQAQVPDNSEELRRQLADASNTIEQYQQLYNVADTKIKQLQLQLRDLTAKTQTEIDAFTVTLRRVNAYNHSLEKIVNEVRSTLSTAPDVLSQLRVIAGLE